MLFDIDNFWYYCTNYVFGIFIPFLLDIYLMRLYRRGFASDDKPIHSGAGV